VVVSGGSLRSFAAVSDTGKTQPTRPTKSSDHPSSHVAPLAGSVHGKALLANAVLYRGDGEKRVRLQEGARVAPGDALSLTISGEDSMYVYVLNEDSSGDVYVLFPVAGLYPENPLPPGAAHRLPGRFRTQPVNWEITTAGGRENILVLANRTPLAALEQELLRFRACAGYPFVMAS
jgi:hypothetical protein